jgi:hypothetical protein
MAVKMVSNASSPDIGVVSGQKFIPVRPKSASLKTKFAKFIGNLAGVADIPEDRLMIDEPRQVDVANDFLTVVLPTNLDSQGLVF